MPNDLDRLLDLLADRPNGELSTVLHFSHGISEEALTDAMARGYVSGTLEPLKNVRHPPLRLRITQSGAALHKLADA